MVWQHEETFTFIIGSLPSPIASPSKLYCLSHQFFWIWCDSCLGEVPPWWVDFNVTFCSVVWILWMIGLSSMGLSDKVMSELRFFLCSHRRQLWVSAWRKDAPDEFPNFSRNGHQFTGSFLVLILGVLLLLSGEGSVEVIRGKERRVVRRRFFGLVERRTTESSSLP